MKKLLLVSIAFCFVTCESEGTRIDDYRTKERFPFSAITHFEYKGHDYIFFDTDEGRWAVGGVVHDPDCRCKEIQEGNK